MENFLNCVGQRHGAEKPPIKWEQVAYDPDGKPYTVKYQYLTTMLLNQVRKQHRRAEAKAEVIKSQERKKYTSTRTALQHRFQQAGTYYGTIRT